MYNDHCKRLYAEAYTYIRYLYHKLTPRPWKHITSLDRVEALKLSGNIPGQFAWALRIWAEKLVQLRHGGQLTSEQRDLLVAVYYLVGNNAVGQNAV